MLQRLIFILLIVTGSLVGSAQAPKYTPKHFVEFKDTVEFKPIRPPKNGFGRVYLELDRPEIWDTDDNNTTQVTGWQPALVCIEGNFKDGKKK